MYRSSSARSSSVGSERSPHSRRWRGRCFFIVARARWSALFTAATLMSRSEALSAADQPRTSLAINTARCFGESSWIAAMYASSIVSLATTSASGSASGVVSVSSWSGYGWSPGTSPRGRGHGVRGPDGGRARESVEAGIRRDSVQPGPEGRPALEALSLPPGSEERLLDEILGVFDRAEHAVAVHLQLAAVRLDERCERSLVAGAGGGDRLGLRRLGGGHERTVTKET